MKIAVAGSRSFGAAVVAALEDAGRDVSLVAAEPGDRLRVEADRRGIPARYYLTPDHGADLIVAAHSHYVIGQASIAAATVGAIGYHPSLLPRHRGRDAVRWTVHMRDPIAGGTVYWLTGALDAGPIAKQRWCHVRPEWNHSDLWRHELFPMGVDLILQTIDDVASGLLVEVPQDEGLATWEPSWERPPLYRPELPQIGGRNGYEVTADPRAAVG